MRPSSPRRRGSSTPRPIDTFTDASGILDHPPSRVMTANSILAASSARNFARNLAPLNQRAEGRPGARRTRGLVRGRCNKGLRTIIQVWLRHPAFPALKRDRPGDRLSCHHRHWTLSLTSDLTPAPGRRTQTISPYASAALVSRSLRVHRSPSVVGQDGRKTEISGNEKQIVSFLWTGRPKSP